MTNAHHASRLLPLSLTHPLSDYRKKAMPTAAAAAFPVAAGPAGAALQAAGGDLGRVPVRAFC